MRRHPDVEIDMNVVEGHAAPALVDASRGADLLVVGSRGHGEFVGVLLGSVSEPCVTNAHCPPDALTDPPIRLGRAALPASSRATGTLNGEQDT